MASVHLKPRAFCTVHTRPLRFCKEACVRLTEEENQLGFFFLRKADLGFYLIQFGLFFFMVKEFFPTLFSFFVGTLKMRKHAISFRNLLPLSALVFLPWILLHFLSSPSCSLISSSEEREIKGASVQLKAMVVGDLHLTGPRTIWLDRVRRDAFMKASFKRAYRVLKPHTLLVLGDISDWGRKSTEEQWKSVVDRFNDMAKPFLGLSYHVSAGNHDIGDFYQITPTLLHRFVNTFPGLDETGSAIFTIRNISFVSLNAMALACDACPMHGSMQKVVEVAQSALQTGSNGSQQLTEYTGQMDSTTSSSANAFQRPVLLLHLPLYRADESVCDSVDAPRCAPWHELEGGCLPLFASAQSSKLYTLTPYRSMIDMLSLNTSRYLLSALKPSLVLSAHAHRFCDRVLDDGTREITVSTFTWRNRDDPSFLLINFYKDGTRDIRQCCLPRESFVLAFHVLQGTVLLALITVGSIHFRMVRKRLHLKA